MRRKVKNRNIVKPELKYNNERLAKFINYVMESGKKNTARRAVYQALDLIKEKEKVEDVMVIFEEALRNAGPTVEVRSRRVGGANYQVPREVRPERRLQLAMRWMVAASRGKKGKPIHEKLAEEIILASKNEGEAIKKKENVHKMAEANKAFAHFAW